MSDSDKDETAPNAQALDTSGSDGDSRGAAAAAAAGASAAVLPRNQGRRIGSVRRGGQGPFRMPLSEREHGPRFYAEKQIVKAKTELVTEIKQMPKEWWTRLHEAAKGGSAAECRGILEAGHRDWTRFRSDDGKTPYHVLLANYRTLSKQKVNECLRVMITFGDASGLDIMDDDGITPLMQAVKLGIADTCELILEIRGKETACARNNSGRTALHMARKIEIVQLLLKYGAAPAVNVADICGRTPLFYMVDHGDIECALAIIDAGASCSAVDLHGFNVLHIAASREHLDICELVIGQIGKAGLFAQDVVGTTPLMYMIRYDSASLKLRSMKCVHFMLENGGPALVNMANENGITALMMAAKRCDVDLCRELITAGGANVHARDNEQGWTALHYAAKCTNATLCDMLIMYGASVRAVDKSGNTPLHLTSLYPATMVGNSWRCAETCRTLLRHGADPLAKNTVPASLIKPTAEHTNGMSPADVFCKFDDTEIISIFAMAGAPLPDSLAILRPLANWSPAVHLRYPYEFRRAVKTLLLCTVREESLIYGVSKYVVMHIVSFLHAFDF